MAESGTNIAEYLHGCRGAVIAESDRKLHIVIGNEAADADSFVSAITLAYFFHLKRDTNDPVLVVPVACIPAEDVELRRDVAVLLQKAGMDIRDILTLTDLASVTENFTSNTRVQAVTLVDHNKLTPTLHNLFGERVVEICDHHEDAREYLWVSDDKRQIAFQSANDDGPSRALVASTCTLVAEKFWQEAQGAISAELALVLAGVILLDSINLNPAAGKVTPRDETMVEQLCRYVTVNTTSLFEELNGTKSDPEFWRSLSVTNCLRIDCKQFEAGGKRVVMSSVLLPVQGFTAKEAFDEQVDKFIEQHNADLLVVLTLTYQPELRRQLCCIARNSDLLDGLAGYLESSAASSLQLQQLERKHSAHHDIVIYEQGNRKHSRKQVAPIILQYFEAH